MHLNLSVARYRDGKLLERRRQRGRSFTLPMLQLLYIAHAQILQAAPYTMTDIMGQLRQVDNEASGGYIRKYKGTLNLCAPGGNGSMYIPCGGVLRYDATRPYWTVHPMLFFKGDILGIQIGGDNTAVTPSDTHLGQKIFHGVNGPVAGPASFDAHTTGDTGAFAIDAATKAVACFIFPTRGFRMSAVRLLLYRTGNPGNMILTIRGIRAPENLSQYALKPETTGNIDSITENGNTLPVGAPYEWREFTLTTPIDMQPGLCYAFALEVPLGSGGNSVSWRYQDVGGVAAVPNQEYAYSGDTQVTWNLNRNYRLMIEPRGSALGEMEYGGCDMFGRTVANPNDEFSICRLFRNNSGGAISVEEVALYAAVTRYGLTQGTSSFAYRVGDAYAACIARDVVAPAVNVLNGENLEVIYTPQITV
jgi:hypothetical protein